MASIHPSVHPCVRPSIFYRFSLNGIVGWWGLSSPHIPPNACFWTVGWSWRKSTQALGEHVSSTQKSPCPSKTRPSCCKAPACMQRPSGTKPLTFVWKCAGDLIILYIVLSCQPFNNTPVQMETIPPSLTHTVHSHALGFYLRCHHAEKGNKTETICSQNFIEHPPTTTCMF